MFPDLFHTIKSFLSKFQYGSQHRKQAQILTSPYLLIAFITVVVVAETSHSFSYPLALRGGGEEESTWCANLQAFSGSLLETQINRVHHVCPINMILPDAMHYGKQREEKSSSMAGLRGVWCAPFPPLPMPCQKEDRICEICTAAPLQ